MPSKRKLESLADYSRALKKGFGVGQRESYQPWLTVDDVSTKGTATIIRGFKSKREHHLLAHGEKQFFLHAEFNDNVVDIREQFPLLPLDLLRQLSEELGVKYPRVPVTQEVNVQTTDFLLTFNEHRSTASNFMAVSVKQAQELTNRRTLEKLELERAWWEILGVPYRIFCPTSESARLSTDIEWLTSPLRNNVPPKLGHLESAANSIPEATMPFSECIARVADATKKNELEAQKLFRSIVALKYISIDLSHSIHDARFITVLKAWRGERRDEA